MTEFYAEDNDLDFWSNMGQDEAASEEETPAEAVVAEEAPAAADTAEPEAAAEPEAEAEPEPGPARDPETGRFMSKEDAAAIEDPDVQRFLSKYGGDPEKALRAAVEAEKMIGKQGSELGELRRVIEERFAAAEPEDTGNEIYDPNALEEWFDANPHQVPVVALQAHHDGNEFLRDAAMLAWEDLDRAGAKQFERQVLRDELRREQQAAQTQASQASDLSRTAAQEFGESHPDLAKFAPAMQELAGQYPSMLEILGRGSKEAQIEVLDFLYTKARARHADTLTATTKEVAAAQEADADRAIQEAAVASATTVKADPPRKGAADVIGEEWEAYEAPRRDGWNLGSR